MLSREIVRRNQIKLASTENSQKCLITLYIIGWVIIITGHNGRWSFRTGLNNIQLFGTFKKKVHTGCLIIEFVWTSLPK